MPTPAPTVKDTLTRAQLLAAQLSAWRRDFHRHPELGFQEFETAKRVARALTELGVEFRAGVGKTGLVADIDSGVPGKRIALRADMDALPILEANMGDYASQTLGVMHACGHDAHTAMLLGAAALFTQLPPERGSVRLLFQPCEETTDAEGRSGAQRMIEDDAMEGVDAVLALHVSPLIPVGKVGYDDFISASIDDFTLTLRGPGGHAASPNLTVDTVMVLGQVINALYAGVARALDPMHQAVLTIGAIHGGVARNVIPAEITLEGTLRTRNLQARADAMAVCDRAVALAQAFGAQADWRWHGEGFPMSQNDPAMIAAMVATARDLLGSDCVSGDRELGLGGEDFTYFALHAPGAMLYLGTQMEMEGHGAWHTPTFDVAEEALPLGSAILVESARRLLH
jgi:amidohydrolase